MTSLWDFFMPVIKWVSTPEMLEDLAFYRKHDKELYFNGLVGAAIMITVLEFFFMGIAIILILNQVYISGFILLGIAFVGGTGFNQIKLYLHIRKDAIEIKELLK